MEGERESVGGGGGGRSGGKMEEHQEVRTVPLHFTNIKGTYIITLSYRIALYHPYWYIT